MKALLRWIVATFSLFTEERIQRQPETMFATSEMQRPKSSHRSLHTGVPRRRLNVQKPDLPGWRSETGGFLVTQSWTDGSVWGNSATHQNIPESTSARFSSEHSINKTAEPDGEGVKKVQHQTCARTEEWTCTICTGENHPWKDGRGGVLGVRGGQNKSHRQRRADYSGAAIWRSANTAAALRSVKVIKIRNQRSQPASSLPAQIN